MSETKAQFWVDNSNLNGKSGFPVLDAVIKTDGKFVLQYDNILPESLNMTLDNFTTLAKRVDQVIVGYFKEVSDVQALRCAVTELVVTGLDVAGLSKAEAA